MMVPYEVSKDSEEMTADFFVTITMDENGIITFMADNFTEEEREMAHNGYDVRRWWIKRWLSHCKCLELIGLQRFPKVSRLRKKYTRNILEAA